MDRWVGRDQAGYRVPTLPKVAEHRNGRVEWIDRITMFIPAMWVDIPASIMERRDIFGIAKQ